MDKFFKCGVCICIAILLASICGLWYTTINNSKDEELAATSVESPSKYDTSALEAWCGEPKGTVRMIGGWYADKTHIETEDGNLWEMNTESINEFELLLIWFDDMNTPETEDDEIIKIWSEVYD